jgi:hypothetical protein
MQSSRCFYPKLMKFEFSRQFFFSKNTQSSNLIEIRELGAESFRASKWTDGHDEAISRF